MASHAIQALRSRIWKASFRRLLTGSLALLLALVWLGGAAQLWFERESYLDLAERASESLTMALAEYVRQSAENIDNTLQDVAVQSRTWLDPAGRQSAAEYLRLLAERDSVISAIHVYDARGQLQLSSEYRRPEFQSVANRADFTAHRAGNHRGLYIGDPQRVMSGEWHYPFSRRISGGQGEFLGMAVGNLDATAFQKFFATMEVGDGGLVALLHTDGILLIRRPRMDSSIGKLPADALIPALAKRAPRGAFSFTSRFDQTLRFGYYRVLDSYPLIVTVSLTESHALLPWRRLVAQLGVTLCIITVAVFLLGRVVLRQHARVELAEARARERQQQLEGISRNMPAVVFQRVRDPGGHSFYNFVDPKIREMFGIAPEETRRGVGVLEAVTQADDMLAIRASFERSANDLSEWNHEFRIEPPGKGLRWMRGAATPRKGAEGEVIWDGVFFDITAEKQAEDHLQRSHRMETVGELASGVAHQFNNLLMSIQGHLELIQLESKKGDSVSNHANTALEAVERGATLTRQLLAFSRRQRLEPTAFNLNEALRETGSLLGVLLGRNVRIEFNLRESLPGVRIDRGLFQTAVIALGLNAKEAMPDGGALVLSTTVEDLPAGEVSSSSQPAGPYVTVRVKDSGVGMEEDVQQRAFDPFFSTKGTGSRTGLGLSQVHGFMKQSGGVAAIRSAPGLGTEVSLYFPVDGAPAPSSGLAARSA